MDSGFGNIDLKDGTCRRLTNSELSERVSITRWRKYFPNGIPLMSVVKKAPQPFEFEGVTYLPAKGNHWKVAIGNLPPCGQGRKVVWAGKTLTFKRYLSEIFQHTPLTNIWMTQWKALLPSKRTYVVQTSTKVVQRCLLMATDPGDLVLDPTCGSGTAAYVAEQWGRRWITIDTSRVALALARARIMGARYLYYLLSDSRDGQLKEAEVTSRAFRDQRPPMDNIRQGFVYERVPHITLKSIANNAEIDVIWDKWQAEMEPLREN